MRSLRTLIPTSVVAAAAFSLLVTGCGGGSATTAATTTPQSGPLAFAHCMHSHGVPGFPDPTSSGEIPKARVVPLASSPQFQPAQRACQYLQPEGGPAPSAAQRRAHTVALLAFARCLRSHGFPRFPDPTTSGQVTHQMLANLGINLHQPAVLQSADTCVSVTHGALTKTDVARFVAGQ